MSNTDCGGAIAGRDGNGNSSYSDLVELRRLRYFVAVAEEGGFTRASEVLRIAQPSLSAQVRLLEEEIGAPLLVRGRGSRGVTLTPVGQSLLVEAREILGHVDRSLATIKRQAERRPAPIRLGVPAGVRAALLADVTRRLLTVPGAELEPVTSTTAMAMRSLADGSLELALVHLPVEGTAMLLPILDEPLGLWLPADHPLSGSDTVAWSALDGLPVGLFQRSISPACFDYLTALVTAAGPRPDWREVDVTDSAAVARVLALGIPQMGMREIPFALPGMTWRRLEGDLLRLVTALAWRPGPSTVLRTAITALLPLAVGGPTVEPYVRLGDPKPSSALEPPRSRQPPHTGVSPSPP